MPKCEVHGVSLLSSEEDYSDTDNSDRDTNRDESDTNSTKYFEDMPDLESEDSVSFHNEVHGIKIRLSRMVALGHESKPTSTTRTTKFMALCHAYNECDGSGIEMKPTSTTRACLIDPVSFYNEVHGIKIRFSRMAALGHAFDESKPTSPTRVLDLCACLISSSDSDDDEMPALGTEWISKL